MDQIEEDDRLKVNEVSFGSEEGKALEQTQQTQQTQQTLSKPGEVAEKVVEEPKAAGESKDQKGSAPDAVPPTSSAPAAAPAASIDGKVVIKVKKPKVSLQCHFQNLRNVETGYSKAGGEREGHRRSCRAAQAHYHQADSGGHC
jgi:hypothetical protein